MKDCPGRSVVPRRLIATTKYKQVLSVGVDSYPRQSASRPKTSAKNINRRQLPKQIMK